MKPETLEAAQRHAIDEYPRESCGLVVAVGRKQRYVPCRNVADDPLNDFVIADEDYVKADKLGEITAIVHSHPDGRPSPSDQDMLACEAHGLPWVIIAVHRDEYVRPDPYVAGVHEFAPSGFVLPYTGRVYQFGTQDCYTLIQDYYRRELNIELPPIPREDKFWERGQEIYLDNLTINGFVPVPAPSEPGDLVLMTIRSEVTNHGAIWLGEGQSILHHPYEQLSEKVVYGGYWAENFKVAVRKVF